MTAIFSYEDIWVPFEESMEKWTERIEKYEASRCEPKELHRCVYEAHIDGSENEEEYQEKILDFYEAYDEHDIEKAHLDHEDYQCKMDCGDIDEDFYVHHRYEYLYKNGGLW